MRAIHRITAVALVVAFGLVGCSSSPSGSDSTISSPSAAGWQTPEQVLDAVKSAGFDCTLPSSDTQPQIMTKDPFTDKDLGGHALIRCPDFQVMLAKGSVDDGFGVLVTCQAVPQSIRQSPEWSVPVIEGSNFLILPADLSAGWAATSQPKDVIAKLGGAESTFGEIYDRACAGKVGAASDGASAVPSGPVAPSAS